MRKVVLALVALLATGVIASTATATGPIASNEGFVCGILDADGNVVLASSSFDVWYASGKTYLRCEGTVTNDTGNRITYNFANTGLECDIAYSGPTTNWTNTIGRNGSSQLTCIGFADPSAASASSSSSSGLG
jgi:hypothetical protein